MIRRMRAGDVAAMMHLKAAAGWNQTPLDLERLLRLEPDGCFVVARDGAAVGATTALRHGGGVAWIGMVLVLPAYRRRGIALGLMRHALRWLEGAGIRTVGLDATAMGRPLYAKLGFRDWQLIERWTRSPGPCLGEGSGGAVGRLPERLLAMDRAACGYDRSALLHDLAEDPSVSWSAGERCFAFLRPGSDAWQLGPCVAASGDEAAATLAGLLSPVCDRPVFWDILPSNETACSAARRLGFLPARRLTRMFLGDEPSVADACQHHVWAAAGFELG